MAATPRRRRGGPRSDLFDDDRAVEASSSDAPSTPFDQLLRETPPAPLSMTVQYGLWAVGAVTLLLFLASVLRVVG